MLIAPLAFMLVFYGLGGLTLLVVERVLPIAMAFHMLDIEGPLQFLALTLALVCQIAFLQLVTKSALGRHRWLELGTGGLVGIVLAATLEIVRAGLFSIYLQNLVNTFHGALIWLSVVFFPELLARRVGWGGVIVWAGMVVAIFGAVIGLSFAFAQ